MGPEKLNPSSYTAILSKQINEVAKMYIKNRSEARIGRLALERKINSSEGGLNKTQTFGNNKFEITRKNRSKEDFSVL